MKTKLRLPFIAAWLLLALARITLHAQLVADGATLNLTTATNLPGNLIVGTNAGSTTLNLIAPGTVTNASGFVGYNIGATKSKATVQNTNAVWRNTGDLHIGTNSQLNSLVISNGGRVISANGLLGYTTSGSNNQVTVTGPGSLWTSTLDLYLGVNGSFNTLHVTNGATLANQNGYIGNSGSSAYNTALVAGTNSRWDNSGNLTVGNFGGGNQLIIGNGATVADSSAYLGSRSGSGNNHALVTGTNSHWSNSSELLVGNIGSGNQLIVSNGASVTDQVGHIGSWDGSGNNTALVTGANSRWTNTSELRVGRLGSGNQLVVSNGGAVFSASGVIGDVITSYAASVSNSVTVTGANSLWTSSELRVGNAGSGNQLIVSNGARVISSNSFIGYVTSGSNNQVTVTGPGSIWDSGASLGVGESGSFNSMLITNGGFVTNAWGYLGFSAFSRSNQVTVTGLGSRWDSRTYLDVGYDGSGHQLIVSDGATVTSDRGYIGFQGSSNTALVTGPGSLWTNISFLSVGVYGNNNQLIVTNGGEVWAPNVRVGPQSGNGGTNNTLRLANGTLTAIDGVLVTSNNTLVGNGTVAGPVTIAGGGILSPGNSVGKLILSNSPSLSGTLLMELAKNGGTLTNDQLAVTAPLTYGGTLTVTHLGPDALTAGDTFALFTAPSYAGAFTTLTLPALSSGLIWTNQLLVNGTIQVVAQPPPTISGLVQSGTNLVFTVAGGPPGGGYTLLTSTNAALPVLNWTTNSTGNFDWLGNVTLTNTINPATPQGFFTIRVP